MTSRVHEHSMVILDGLPMTEDAATAVGHAWLAEDPTRTQPLCIVYRDIEGRPRIAWIGDLPWSMGGKVGGK